MLLLDITAELARGSTGADPPVNTRRTFMRVLTVVFAAASLPVRAQFSGTAPLVGYLGPPPSVGPFRQAFQEGMSYGASSIANYRRAAYLVDKILRGAKPASLPVEQPAKFELVVNLKTAATLCVAVPPSLLVRADELVQ